MEFQASLDFNISEFCFERRDTKDATGGFHVDPNQDRIENCKCCFLRKDKNC